MNAKMPIGFRVEIQSAFLLQMTSVKKSKHGIV